MVTAWNSSGEDHAPEAGGIGRIIGRENLLEDAGLDLLVRSRTEGLGDVEGDFARGQCLEHDGRKRREAQTALDEADGKTEEAGNLFDRRTACYDRGKGLCSVGRVHGQAVELLRKPGLDRGCSTVLEQATATTVHSGGELFVS